MIKFEYCPILGLKWYEFKRPHLTKTKNSKKRKTGGNNGK